VSAEAAPDSVGSAAASTTPAAIPRGLVAAAFFLSGATALVYEVIWSRYLSLFLGGTATAHTVVLGTFMAGLACGNAVFGRWADRPGSNGLRLYAVLEAGIGTACLLFPTAFTVLSAAYVTAAGAAGPLAAINPLLKVGFAAASMFLPCALMGGTLPALARHAADSLAGVGARVSRLYFINTAGAVLGSLAGGFYLVERWGLEVSILATALVNLVIGGVFYCLPWSRGGRPAPPAAGDADAAGDARPYSPAQARTALLCIGVAGALALLYELAWIRLLVLSIGPTVHSFTTMLASFISGIAFGSAYAARRLHRGGDALALLGLCELGVALSILVPLPLYPALPFAFHRVGSWLAHTPEAYPVFLFAQVLLSWLVMLVPTTLMGAALPLASRVCIERLDSVGKRVGDVFSVNTIGTVVGAAATGFVLLPWLGLQRTFLVGAAGSGVLAVVLLRSWRSSGGDAPFRALRDAFHPSRSTAAPQRLWPSAAALLAVVGVASASRWDPRLLQAGLYRWERDLSFSWSSLRSFVAGRDFAFIKDASDATVAVERIGEQRQLIVNGKPDASTGPDLPTQLMVGHLGMLLNPNARRAMVVGLGSGASAAAVLRYPGASVDVAEISPAVVDAAGFFTAINDGVLQNPHMSLAVVDAREYLLLTRSRYDVIVSQPTNLWVPGVASLFTREFYEIVRARLADGGVFVQWLQLYSMDADTVASVVASLGEVFPVRSAWCLQDADLLLVGSVEPLPFDPDAFARRLSEARAAEGLPAHRGLSLFRHPLLLLSTQLASAEDVAFRWPRGSAPIFRDALPRLEFRAARNQFLARPYRLAQEMSEPFARLGREPLLVERYLERHPLDGPRRQTLANILSGLGEPHARAGRALGLAATLAGEATADLTLSLGDATAGSVLLATALAERIERGAASAEACRAYLRAHGELLKQANSPLSRPAATLFEKRADSCMARHPESAAALQAALIRALAEAGASEAALTRFDALAGHGLIEALPAAERTEVLAAAAAAAAKTGRHQQARLLAQRALTSDASNKLASRILAALRPN
jgi:predicted membrane-bound spermidine synthase